MTTIACDGTSMAGDGQSGREGLITCLASVKIDRLDDGRIVGCAGDKPDAYRFREWLNSAGKPPKLNDLAALVLHPDGRLFYHTDADIEGTVTEAPNAIGSGASLAIGAMEAGTDARRAVEIASKRDPHTGGVITVISR